MFASFYQLREQPFGAHPDPAFLYLSKTHREVFSSLLYRIKTDCGFLAMIAEPGMGKTTLLFHLLNHLQTMARTAFIFQTQCTSNEFMRYLLSEFGYAADTTDPVRMSQELKAILVGEATAGSKHHDRHHQDHLDVRQETGDVDICDCAERPIQP